MGERQRNSVGTSLRGCIRDILDGGFPIDRVDRIYASTAFATREELIDYLTAGKTTQKERMAQIAGRLWDNGKIVQPRMDGGEMPDFPVTELWVRLPPKTPAPIRPAKPLF